VATSGLTEIVSELHESGVIPSREALAIVEFYEKLPALINPFASLVQTALGERLLTDLPEEST